MRKRTSRHATEIREAFKKIGRRIKMSEFAASLLREGIFSPEEVKAFTLRGLTSECRRILSEDDPATGVPFAQEADRHEWKQTALLTLPEAESLLGRLAKGIQCDVTRFEKLATYFESRFGFRLQTELPFEIREHA